MTGWAMMDPNGVIVFPAEEHADECWDRLVEARIDQLGGTGTYGCYTWEEIADDLEADGWHAVQVRLVEVDGE